MSMLTPELVWFVCGVVLLLLEFVVPGVILVFFGFGAWVTALTTYLGLTGGSTSQLLVFAVVSVVLLFGLRRYIRSRFSGFISDQQEPDRNLDEFTGKSVLVLEDIASGKPGKVEFKGAPWRAESEDSLSQGENGIIEKADGLTLIIKKQGG
jgi:membrane protein implicated in regulation of membrane protease activity